MYKEIIDNAVNLVLSNYDGIKLLQDFTQEELKLFPLSYMLKYARPSELQCAWHKLPKHITKDKKIRMKLPCTIHFNRPDQETHFEGETPSRQYCDKCYKSR